jgi:hypothetical protein
MSFANQTFCELGFLQTKAGAVLEHEQDVIQMNEVRRRASEWVQRGTPKVAS